MRWKLERKMLLGYGTSFLLTGVVLAWAVVSLDRLGRAADAIMKDNYRSVEAARVMGLAAESERSALTVLATGHYAEARESYDREHTRFLQAYTRAQDNITEAGEAEIVGDLGQAYATWTDAAGEALRSQDGAGGYAAGLSELADQVFKSLDALRVVNENAMLEKRSRATKLAAAATVSMLAAGGSALLVGLGFSVFLSRRLARPLRDLTAATERLASGAYETRVPAQADDELGQLGRSFNAMVRGLQSYHEMNVERLYAEQRRSEAVIRAIDDGIVLVDEELRVLNMNPAAEAALGVRFDAVHPLHAREVLDDRALYDRLKRAVETGAVDAPEEEEYLTRGQGETQRHYQAAITPIPTSERKLAGVVLLLRDVTKLRELDRLKSEFVAVAAHELRTPLTTVEMAVGLLRERYAAGLPDADRKLLDAAEEETRRLRALVNDLLDLSKIESGRMEMDLEPHAVSELLEQTRGILERQAAERKVELVVEIPAEAGSVRADGAKIVWVLTNLVANALRYTPEGGWIRVSASATGTLAAFSVADNGPGIAREDQGRIFGKFVRAEGDRIPGGTGLGLAICREIVRAHGGTIWVESEPGRGSVFSFTLPRA